MGCWGARAHLADVGETETKQRREGKHMLRTAASIRVMLLNMQITFMMAERIDHIQRFFIRPNDLRFAKRDPDISCVDIHIGSSSGVKIFGVVLRVSRLDAHMKAHSIR